MGLCMSGRDTWVYGLVFRTLGLGFRVQGFGQEQFQMRSDEVGALTQGSYNTRIRMVMSHEAWK